MTVKNKEGNTGKMKRKNTLLLLAGITCIIVNSSFVNAEDTSDFCFEKGAVVEGAIFSGSTDKNVPVTVKYQPEWITDADNKIYNSELAEFAALLCADSYFREKDLAKGTQTRLLFDGSDSEEYTFTSMLSELGFEDVKHIESFNDIEYEYDPNDSVVMNLAHDGSGENDIYIAVIRGCYSAGEWLSGFDPGAEAEEYEAVTGPHPEWTDKTVFKGVDIAANRAVDIIRDFIEENDDQEKPDRILITGHSRGGSIAAIVSEILENEADIVSYTYTFEAPAITTSEDAHSYENIFNILDVNDIYTYGMPFGNETFYRFGIDRSTEIIENDEIVRAINDYTGQDEYHSLTKELIDEYVSMFGKLFNDRGELYREKILSETFDDETAATERHDEIAAIIDSENGLGLEAMCDLKDVETSEDGKYVVEFTYYDAAILTGLAKTFSYGEAAGEALEALFKEIPEVSEIVDFINEHRKESSEGHRLLNSYVLTAYVK